MPFIEGWISTSLFGELCKFEVEESWIFSIYFCCNFRPYRVPAFVGITGVVRIDGAVDRLADWSADRGDWNLYRFFKNLFYFNFEQKIIHNFKIIKNEYNFIGGTLQNFIEGILSINSHFLPEGEEAVEFVDEIILTYSFAESADSRCQPAYWFRGRVVCRTWNFSKLKEWR